MSHLIETVYNLLWGDLFTLPVGGGIGISLMAVLLLTAGVFFTLRTRLLPVRLFRDMIAAVCEKNQSMDSLSSFQTLIVSTATRVGMGNLVGVVAAVSAGGAGAVFWMWVTALLGASTSFVESTLAQKYRQPDPLYGGQRGGPAYYIHVLAERKRGKNAASFYHRGAVCHFGPHLLVRHQPGHQQLGQLCLCQCVLHPAHCDHGGAGGALGGHCPAQGCHREKPGCYRADHGGLLFRDDGHHHRGEFPPAARCAGPHLLGSLRPAAGGRGRLLARC